MPRVRAVGGLILDDVALLIEFPLNEGFPSIVGGNVTFLENVGNGFAIRGKFSIMYIYHTAKAAGRLELLERKDTRLWEKTKYG